MMSMHRLGQRLLHLTTAVDKPGPGGSLAEYDAVYMCICHKRTVTSLTAVCCTDYKRAVCGPCLPTGSPSFPICMMKGPSTTGKIHAIAFARDPEHLCVCVAQTPSESGHNCHDTVAVSRSRYPEDLSPVSAFDRFEPLAGTLTGNSAY
jgi:hypothetical protein